MYCGSKKVFSALLIVFLLAGTLNLAAAIVVKKTVEFNPSISVRSAVDSELTNEITGFVKICGWFQYVGDNAKSDYRLSCQYAGNFLQVTLNQDGAGNGKTWRIQRNFPKRELAKIVVDTIIESAFQDLKVRGFCRSKIAFCAETSPGIRNIYICDIDGKNVEQITTYRSLCAEPAWRPDGKSICYSRYSRTGIDIAETTVAKPRASRILSSYSGINAGAAISPDCQKLAMILSPDHKVDLYVRDFRSRRLLRLTNSVNVEASPCWSPDGTKIAFVSEEGGASRIAIISANGGQKQILQPIGRDAVTPDWSDDNKIVYATRVDGAYTIAVYDLKTGKNTRVVQAPGNWESPTWAADNRQVVCKCTNGRKSALYVIDTRTGNTRRLMFADYPLSMPAWSPCVKK